MKFLHLSDTHVGRADYKLKERENDYYQALKQAVSIAINEKVDFVIHTGDFFDKGNPTHKSVVQAIRQLNRLKEKNIPVFVISGSHDMALDETVISVLEEAGLVTNVAHPKYYEINESIVMKGLFYKNVFLCGMAGRQANIQEIFRKLKPNPESAKADYKIFMFHHTISDISTQFMDVPTALLPEGFDYYAAGHWHSAYTTKHGTGIVQYAGSTEYNDKKDMETGEKKRVITVDTETGYVKHHYLKTREFRMEKINCDGLSPKETTYKCMEKIGKSKGALLFMTLHGQLREGSKSMIDRLKIKEEARQKGYLHCQFYMGELLNPDEKKTMRKNVMDIEKEYLESKGYSKKEIVIARIILDLMGRNLKNDELQKAKNRVIAELEK